MVLQAASGAQRIRRGMRTVARHVWHWRAKISEWTRPPRPSPVLATVESLQVLFVSGKSLIRWGDGESAMVAGQDLYFQEWNPELASRMGRLLHQYDSDQPYLLAFAGRRLGPGDPSSIEKFILYRYHFWKYYQPSACYLEANLFKGSMIKDNRLSVLRQGLASARKILVLHHNREVVEEVSPHLGIQDRLEHCPIPPVNAYAHFGEIMRTVQRFRPSHDTRVLVAAGPCAKIIVADLSAQTIAYDFGKMFESIAQKNNL